MSASSAEPHEQQTEPDVPEAGAGITSLSRLDRFVVKVIALGVVALGFAVAIGAPWYVKPLGVPTVLLGVTVFCYPDPHAHLRLYRSIRENPP